MTPETCAAILLGFLFTWVAILGMAIKYMDDKKLKRKQDALDRVFESAAEMERIKADFERGSG